MWLRASVWLRILERGDIKSAPLVPLSEATVSDKNMNMIFIS